MTVKLSGAKSLQTAITRRANFLTSRGVERILQDEGKKLVADVQNHVASLSPGDLPDLSPAYKQRKTREVGGPYPLMVRLGNLVASMASAVRRPGGGQGWGLGFIFRGQHYSGLSNQRLADIHRNGEGIQPKRDFVVLPKGWNLRIIARIRAELARRARGG